MSDTELAALKLTIWVNYNHLTRPNPPQMVLYVVGIAPQPPHFRLVKYYSSPRTTSPDSGHSGDPPRAGLSRFAVCE